MEPGLIVCNGCPKSGTHAVMALLDTMGLLRCPGTILGCTPAQHLHIVGARLGLRVAKLIPDNVFILGHVCAVHALDGFRVITVVRDPRNVLVSYCRHRKRIDDVDVSIPEALADFWGAPFVATYRGFLGWRGRSVWLRYEDLPPSAVGDGGGIYRSHDRDSNTRTGSPSQWQDVWNQASESAWAQHGGYELLAEAGYS